MPENKYIRKSYTITLPDGQKKQLRFTGKTEGEAIAKREKAKLEYEMGLLIVNSSSTFAKWRKEWLDTYVRPKVSASTCKEAEGVISRYFASDLDRMKLCDIRLFHVQRCLNAMEGKSKSYINRATVYIKQVFRKAYENDLIAKDPTVGLTKPHGIVNQRRSLTAKEIDFFKAVIPKHPKGPFFGIMLACGLRPGEARALTWFNVDSKKKQITITQAVEHNSNNIKAPKTVAGYRTIPIPEWYMHILNGIERMDSAYVFPNQQGQPLSTQNYSRAWRSFLREMDIAAGAKLYRNKIIVHAIEYDITPYNLRHTYATQLAEKGVDLKQAQYLLGHDDIQMTANIYTHVTPKMVENAREKINEKETRRTLRIKRPAKP